jgi:hypothetical protein
MVFTRADTLRGSYGPYRANNDLMAYDLDIRVDVEEKFIAGTNRITFRMLEDGARIQLDLFENMNVDSILLGETVLPYAREHNAVFVDFPFELKSGETHAIDFHYSGHPREAGRFGGMAFRTDSLGNPWVYTSCQNIGASLWWPNKDQQPDEPERMSLSVTVPSELVNVSNGRFQGAEDLGDGTTKYRWEIHYPINNYSVSCEHRPLHPVRRHPGGPHPGLLRPPPPPGGRPPAVRPGQAHAGVLQRTVRRLSLPEGRLQAHRGPLRRHGAPERHHLRKPVHQRVPGAGLDRGGNQPSLRLHHHPRERPRVVRQQRHGQRRLRRLDPRGVRHLDGRGLRGVPLGVRRRHHLPERIPGEGQEPGAHHRSPGGEPLAHPGPVLQGGPLPEHPPARGGRRRGLVGSW